MAEERGVRSGPGLLAGAAPQSAGGRSERIVPESAKGKPARAARTDRREVYAEQVHGLPVNVTGTETGIANESTGRRFPIVALDTTPPITDDNPPHYSTQPLQPHPLNTPLNSAYERPTFLI